MCYAASMDNLSEAIIRLQRFVGKLINEKTAAEIKDTP
jgi:hypothetical protein